MFPQGCADKLDTDPADYLWPGKVQGHLAEHYFSPFKVLTVTPVLTIAGPDSPHEGPHIHCTVKASVQGDQIDWIHEFLQGQLHPPDLLNSECTFFIKVVTCFLFLIRSLCNSQVNRMVKWCHFDVQETIIKSTLGEEIHWPSIAHSVLCAAVTDSTRLNDQELNDFKAEEDVKRDNEDEGEESSD